jgi:preprotein translocase subunit Sss1
MPIHKLARPARKPLCDERTMSIWVARFIPLLLMALVGYATFVVIALLAGLSSYHAASDPWKTCG